MTCTHTLFNLGGTPCTRPDAHTSGHVYVSSTGSEVDDRHTGGGHE